MKKVMQENEESEDSHCYHHQHDSECENWTGLCDENKADHCVHCKCCCNCLACEYRAWPVNAGHKAG